MNGVVLGENETFSYRDLNVVSFFWGGWGKTSNYKTIS